MKSRSRRPLPTSARAGLGRRLGRQHHRVRPWAASERSGRYTPQDLAIGEAHRSAEMAAQAQALDPEGYTCVAEPWDYAFHPARTALLVIDMQNDFCAIGGYCHEYMAKKGLGEEAIALIREPIGPLTRVLAAARAAGMMVVYTSESHWPDMSDVPHNKLEGTIKVGAPIGSEGPLGRLLIRGEPGTEIVEELQPLPGEHVVHKPGKGSFFATDLDHILRNRRITHLVITGVTTDCCVLTTRMEALDRGYHTLQIEDCCAATRRENHQAVFNMIRTHPEAFGLMTSSENLIACLRLAPMARRWVEGT